MYFCSMLPVVVVSGGGCREPLKGATLLSGRVHVKDCHEVVQRIRKSNKQRFDYELKLAKVNFLRHHFFWKSKNHFFYHMRWIWPETWQLDASNFKPLEVWDAIAELAEIVGDAAPQGAGETQRYFLFLFGEGWNLSKRGMVRFTKSGEGYFMNPCILEVSQYPPKVANQNTVTVICSHLVWIALRWRIYTIHCE